MQLIIVKFFFKGIVLSWNKSTNFGRNVIGYPTW